VDKKLRKNKEKLVFSCSILNELHGHVNKDACRNMKPIGEECHEWAEKGKVRLHSLKGRDVLIDTKLVSKQNKDIRR